MNPHGPQNEEEIDKQIQRQLYLKKCLAKVRELKKEDFIKYQGHVYSGEDVSRLLDSLEGE